jgi:integral membrane sensor domain MASE1
MHIDIPRRVHIPYIAMVSIIATAYWAIGKLALLLAIPPGYATAVWPPAGIALAAFLVYGTRVWPGVVLGSFLVNVALHKKGETLASLPGFILPS